MGICFRMLNETNENFLQNANLQQFKNWIGGPAGLREDEGSVNNNFPSNDTLAQSLLMWACTNQKCHYSA